MNHVPEPLLRRFVDGDLEIEAAVEIAEHLDACAQCTRQAETLEPLAVAFAAAEQPAPPAGLAEAVLAEVARPERASTTEIILGGGLLVAAAVLLVAFGDPTAAATRLGVLISALGTAARQFPVIASASVVATSALVLTLAGASIATARLALYAPERRLP